MGLLLYLFDTVPADGVRGCLPLGAVKNVDLLDLFRLGLAAF